LIFGRVDASYTPGEEQIRQCNAVLQVAIEVVQKAMAQGDLREDDPQVIAETAWALCHGCISLELMGIYGGFSPEDLAERYADNLARLMDGLRA
jgi:hypothetical protein